MGLVIPSKFQLGIILLTLLLFSCKKEEDRRCFKSIGETESLTISLPTLHSFKLTGRLKYVFIQDSLHKVVIKGGENIIKHISFDYDSDSVLTISDQNKCHFLRKQNDLTTVEIHVSDLKYIHIQSGDSIASRGTLKVETLNIEVSDGSSSVNLDLDVNTINTYARFGFCDLNYSGKANFCNNNFEHNNQLNATQLKVTQSIFVYHKSAQNIKVDASNCELTGTIFSNGNIMYKGVPTVTDVEKISGKGQLIKID